MRSDETGRLLNQHSSLLTQFNDNINTRRSLNGASRALQRDNETKLRDTAGSLAYATKSLTRSLQENVSHGSYVRVHMHVGKYMHQCHTCLYTSINTVICIFMCTPNYGISIYACTQVDLQGNVNKIHKIGHELHQLLSVTAAELMDMHFTTLEETTAAEHEV